MLACKIFLEVELLLWIKALYSQYAYRLVRLGHALENHLPSLIIEDRSEALLFTFPIPIGLFCLALMVRRSYGAQALGGPSSKLMLGAFIAAYVISSFLSFSVPWRDTIQVLSTYTYLCIYVWSYFELHHTFFCHRELGE